MGRRASDRASQRTRQGTRQRRRPRDESRRVAFDVLRAIDERDAYANLLLPARLRERRLDSRDAALATELTYGTLRGRGTYDAILELCVDRQLAQVEPPVLDVLRLGAHQLLRTRIPAHAAVAATVGLARAVLGDPRARFVNAVLRKVATRDIDGWLAIAAPPAADDPVGALAVTYSHPRWVVEAFREALGGDLDETAEALEADNIRPRVTLLAKPGRISRDELLAYGGEPSAASPYAVHLREGDPAAIPAVRDGRAAVQDEGSQLTALASANAELAGRDARWLDLCTGPGGKASVLAGLARERGARLLAADRQRHRAALAGRAVAGLADVVVADGTEPPWPAGTFDRVLVDVPCTGLGALRRRPEARWRRSHAALAGLGPLQRALLRSALWSARPGGSVVYVTCSPHRAETVEVVDDVLADRRDVRRVDARPFLAGLPDLGPGPYVQLWPHRHGVDALFCAVLRCG